MLGAVVLLINLGAPSGACGASPASRVQSPSPTTSPIRAPWGELRLAGGYPRVVNGRAPRRARRTTLSGSPPPCLRTWWWRSRRVPSAPEGEIRVVLFGSGKEPESGYQAVLGPWSPNGSPAAPRLQPGPPGRERARRSPAGWRRARVPGDLRSARLSARLVTARRGTLGAARPQPRLPDALRAPRAGAPLDRGRALMAELNDPVPLGGPVARPARPSSGEWDVVLRRPRGPPPRAGAFAPAAPPRRSPRPARSPTTSPAAQLGPDWLATDQRR